jgi:membrane protease YdiL (CAAX protease family)
MLILSATDAPNLLGELIIPLLLGIGAATAMAIGLFRRNSITGPARIEDNEPLEPLVIAMGIGMMVYFLGVAFGGAAGGATTQPTTEPILTETGVLIELLARVAGTVVIILALLIFYRGSKRLGLSLNRLPRGVITGAIGMFIVVPVMILAILGTSLAMGQRQEYVHPFLKMLSNTHDEAGRDVILVSILVAAPISEELFFRVCLQTLLGGAISRFKSGWPAARTRWFAVLFTSIVFALAHGDPWAMPPIFVLSLCLGYAYERTGNIWVSITMHAAFNAWQLWMFSMKF